MAKSSPPFQVMMVMRATRPCLALSLILFAAGSPLNAAEPEPLTAAILTNVWDRELAAQVAEVFKALPAPVKQYSSLSQAEVSRFLRQDVNYAQMVREKLDARWFAALVEADGDAPFAIQGRFDTWRGLVEFLAERNALVDVWAWGERGEGQSRRIPAPELGDLQRQRHERPTFVTVTCPDPMTGGAVTYKVEFGFQAAAFARAANEAYQKHRRIPLISRKILDLQSTRLESSHVRISYAVFFL